MGAVAGSWAGLHGPGEKTIRKTGQSGPGPTRDPGCGTGAQGRGLQATLPEWEAPGCQALQGRQLGTGWRNW